jgi:Undecaprenyl-phosphate galactose phosphotransferase WbaP
MSRNRDVSTLRLSRKRNRAIKRAFDLIFGSLLLIPAAPVALIAAIAIKIESPGPVFFAHERIGRNGRRFRLWKFRSMTVDADKVLAEHLSADPEARLEWERAHKLKADPRVTRVGQLLRRSSLDELPQIVSVLAGHMSLVGPRPIVETEIERYGEAFPLYAAVRPGLTGLWQVSGRTDTSYRQRVALDSAYVVNWSISADFRILLRTVRVVLLGHGAY